MNPEVTRKKEKETNLKKYEEYFLRYQLTDRMATEAAKPDANFRDRKFKWEGHDYPESSGISERNPNEGGAGDNDDGAESYQAEIDADGATGDQVAKKSKDAAVESIDS